MLAARPLTAGSRAPQPAAMLLASDPVPWTDHITDSRSQYNNETKARTMQLTPLFGNVTDNGRISCASARFTLNHEHGERGMYVAYNTNINVNVAYRRLCTPCAAPSQLCPRKNLTKPNMYD